MNFLKDMCATVCAAIVWVRKSRKDFAPAYRVALRALRDERQRTQSPLKRGPLFRAGRTARIKALEATMCVSVMMCFLASAMLFLFFAALSLLTGGNIVIPVILLAAILIACVIPVLVYQANNYSLGAWGENVVGDELDKLGRPCWRIFHCVDTGRGDIDHVIVCPKGVFCVETKTLRKDPDKKSEKLIFRDGAIWREDGRQLNSPDPIPQVRHNAGRLYNDLSEKCFGGDNGEKMPFIASIIAFPDWRVEIVGGHYDKNLIPCNPKTIPDIFKNREDKLSDRQIKKICAALEEKNRVDIQNAD